MTLLSVPGETHDVLVVWMPEKDTMVQIANFYQAFPAITTIRGAFPRNPLDYIDSIDICRSLEPEYLVLPHGPQPIIVGEENISQTFTNGRDAIQFVHDQTVQNMNKGLTPGEIMDLVKLPPHLASDPNLQEYYGQVDRDIYEIFWWYRGFYSGKSRDLFPQSPTEEAEMAAELAGGVDELTGKAKTALDEGNLEWALVLADDVLFLDPKNSEAREIKNSAMKYCRKYKECSDTQLYPIRVSPGDQTGNVTHSWESETYICHYGGEICSLIANGHSAQNNGCQSRRLRVPG